jgi:hypothetical protein
MKKNVITADRQTGAQEKKTLAFELAEIEEISELIFSRLEKKLRELSSLDATADAKIAVLQKLLAQIEAPSRPAPAAVAAFPPEIQSVMNGKIAVLEKLLSRAAALEKKLDSVAAFEIAVDKKMGALELLARRAEGVSARFGETDRANEIYALRKKGLSTGEIAEVLGMPQGEVDLTLELNAQNA